MKQANPRVRVGRAIERAESVEPESGSHAPAPRLPQVPTERGREATVSIPLRRPRMRLETAAAKPARPTLGEPARMDHTGVGPPGRLRPTER